MVATGGEINVIGIKPVMSTTNPEQVQRETAIRGFGVQVGTET